MKPWLIQALIFVSLFVLLFSPGIAAFIVNDTPNQIAYFVVAQLGLFLVPVFIFHKRLRLYLYIATILAILAPVALMPLIFFKVEVNTDILTLVINTSFREAWELFGKLFIPIILSIVGYVVLYLYLIKHSIKSISLKKGLAISAAGLVAFVMSTTARTGTLNFSRSLRDGIVAYYPNNIAYNMVKYSSKMKKVDHEKLTENFTFSAHKKDTLNEKEVYVLVIGETARFNNWGLYGYHRNTSPRLGSRKDVLAYTDAATAGAMTELSVPLIITRATPSDFDLHYREKSVGAAFEESGFYTYWISNQADYFNIQMHKKEMDSVINVGSSRFGGDVVHDIVAVNTFDDLLKKSKSKKLFFVLHTIGSHFNYAMRYPESFEVFKPSAQNQALNPMNPANKEIMVNSYDNSILYTDMILDSLINILSETRAVSYLLYLSDHGEDLYDDTRMKFLHPPVPPSKYVAHIPFFIWTSPEYDSTYPSKFKTLKSHLNNPISSSDVFETLLDMANIAFPNANYRQSLASDSFRNSKQLILGGDMKLYHYNRLK